MVRLSLLVVLCLYQTAVVKAQSNADVFDTNVPVYFLGVDFSSARLVAEEGTWNESEVHSFMRSINQVIINEPAKYRVAAAVGRISVENHTKVANTRNDGIKATELLLKENDHIDPLKPSDISKVMKGYDYQGLRGLGLIFNVEHFNKYSLQGVVWVTFVDMQTGKVLITERMEAKPKGFGLRNFWAATIYQTIKGMESKEFSVWRKKYETY
jgi:hypothetical protein